jgi:hypothetical protein
VKRGEVGHSLKIEKSGIGESNKLILRRKINNKLEKMEIIRQAYDDLITDVIKIGKNSKERIKDELFKNLEELIENRAKYSQLIKTEAKRLGFLFFLKQRHSLKF